MLDLPNPSVTLEDEVKAVQSALAGLIVPDKKGPVRSAFDHEPRFFGDSAFGPGVAYTTQFTGFENTSQGAAEILLPDLLTFALRTYFPVLGSDPEKDGLQVAQEKTLSGMSAVYDALIADPYLSGMVVYAGAAAGRILGVEEGGSLLYGLEASVAVRVH